jgi:hypothetical protein
MLDIDFLTIDTITQSIGRVSPARRRADAVRRYPAIGAKKPGQSRFRFGPIAVRTRHGSQTDDHADLAG